MSHCFHRAFQHLGLLRSRPWSRLPILFSLALLLASCGASSAASTPKQSTGVAHSAIKTVFLIVMENHNWSDIQGNASAPYINGTLLPHSSYASQYFNPQANHPSLPNYLWLDAGTNFGVHSDVLPADAQQTSTSHLDALLNSAGISWRAYEDGISGQGCPLSTSGNYAPRHNPFLYFSDVSSRSPYCAKHERPYTQLAADLQRNTVARYNFIGPDLCHDMHTACAPDNNSIKQGDSWLSIAVPQILASSAYKHGGALFITWDEGEGSDGPIGMIVLSPLAKGHGFVSRIRYTHSSTLRTLQEIFGVRPLLGDSAHARDLRNLFLGGTLAATGRRT